MLLDSAETLFLTAKKRVFPQGTGRDAKKSKKDQEGFEENPKWGEIGKILEEIRTEIKQAGLEEAVPSEKVLIVTR